MTVDQLIEDRAARLTAYQNTAYAQQYREHIHAVHCRDPKAEAIDSLTRAAATQLYRLMAIKDEYEVARLHSDPEFYKQLTGQFTGAYKLRFHLAPPLLCRPDPITGKIAKREFGGWIRPFFAGLARLKFLRGTRFDVFGHSAERNAERNDLKRYLDLLSTVITELDTHNYQEAVALATLPKGLRGFGYVRAKNREAMAQQQQQLLAAFLSRDAGTELKAVANA